MTLQAAAQRKFKGKYRGPDRFKGDQKAIAAWKAAGKPAGTVAKPATPELSIPEKITPNPLLKEKYGPLTKTYKGKYIGKDKYKGIAQKGVHKGKYIGVDSRKGLAKPSASAQSTGSEEETLKRLLAAKS